MLEEKINKLILAENEVIDCLKQMYPAGSEVSVMLSNNQVYPSSGTVVWHEGGKFGYVRVRLHSTKKTVRSVSYLDIVDN